MPKRIEHEWKDGKELKWCSQCKRFLELGLFHTTNGRTWDGLFWLCIECTNEKRANNPRINALSAWRHLNKRANNDKRYIKKGIEVKVKKDEFVEWYIRHWFNGCLVDRVNNNGHYELSNMQLLSLAEHNEKNRRDRLTALGITEPTGKRYCYKCGMIKDESEFYSKQVKKSQGNPKGLLEHCKECVRLHRRKVKEK